MEKDSTYDITNQFFSAYAVSTAPRVTFYNNKRSSAYFQRHKRELSKTVYIKRDSVVISKVEILCSSLKKKFYKLPNKILEDSFCEMEDDLDTNSSNGITHSQNGCLKQKDEEQIILNNPIFEIVELEEISKIKTQSIEENKLDTTNDKHLTDQINCPEKDNFNFNKKQVFSHFEFIYQFLQFYEDIKFENYQTCVENIEQNIRLIETQFDLFTKINFDFYFQGENELFNNYFKCYFLLEIIVLGLIFEFYGHNKKLSQSVENLSSKTEEELKIFTDLKSCVTLLNENLITFANLLLEQEGSFKSKNRISSIEQNLKQENFESNNLLNNSKEDYFSLLLNKINITNFEYDSNQMSKLKIELNNNQISNKLGNITESFLTIIKNSNKENENGITIGVSIDIEIKNLDYVHYSLNNLEKLEINKFREFIYTEFILNNLLLIKVCDNSKLSEESKQLEDDNINESIEEVDSNNSSIVIPFPFLPPMNNLVHSYTLVLDLDETLIHYMEENEEAFVKVRPYTDFFLSEMSKVFEIVIFTAATEDYADLILKELDTTNQITHKLYRKHTNYVNDVFIKDLSKLGRDLKKTFIVDNIKENFGLQPENGLHIKSFTGDENDNELFLLVKDLKGNLFILI